MIQQATVQTNTTDGLSIVAWFCIPQDFNDNLPTQTYFHLADIICTALKDKFAHKNGRFQVNNEYEVFDF